MRDSDAHSLTPSEPFSVIAIVWDLVATQWQCGSRESKEVSAEAQRRLSNLSAKDSYNRHPDQTTCSFNRSPSVVWALPDSHNRSLFQTSNILVY